MSLNCVGRFCFEHFGQYRPLHYPWRAMVKTTNTAISPHTFRMFLNQLPQLTASQIEDLLSSAMAIRWARASLAEIEARRDKEHMCQVAALSIDINGGKHERACSDIAVPPAFRPIPALPDPQSAVSTGTISFWRLSEICSRIIRYPVASS